MRVTILKAYSRKKPITQLLKGRNTGLNLESRRLAANAVVWHLGAACVVG